MPVRHHRPRNRARHCRSKSWSTRGKISLTRLVELFTTGPARILRLEPRELWPPVARGDVTIFDTELEWTYDVNRSYSKSKNSPFDGWHLSGGPVATVVGGAVVWRRET